MRQWGNDVPHKEAIKEAALTYATMSLVAGTFVILALATMLFNQGGFVDFSNDDSQMGHSTFYLAVSEKGEAVYTSAENIPRALRETIMDRVYPTPDAAFDAVLEPLPGNAADAHAVLLCTTRDGVISNNTGGSWHSTYWRYDQNGFRYTKTHHVLNAYPSPIVTDTFFARIDKKYC